MINGGVFLALENMRVKELLSGGNCLNFPA